MVDVLPNAILEICVVVGASNEKLKEICQAVHKDRAQSYTCLSPEVRSVHVPPFVTKEDNQSGYFAQNFTRTPRHRSFRKQKEFKHATPVSSNANTSHKEPQTEEFSVPNNIDLQGLPQLCFPGELQIQTEPKEDHYHFLVFTDVFGTRTYGVAVQFYRPIQEGNGFQNGQAHWDIAVHKPRMSLYAPFSICVISKFPYYAAFKDSLSCLTAQVKSCCEVDFDDEVRRFAAKLALMSSPPPGTLHLVFHLKPLEIVLPSREDPKYPIVDLDLHSPFLCFKPECILQILTCILIEQRIVFLSADWALLTLIAECFILYLHPLQWQHTYVPVLSKGMVDFLMAPTAFLMGCHIDYFNQVQSEVEGLILVNIDEGTIKSSSFADIKPDIPEIPVEAAECFTQRVESLQLHYDLELSHLGSCTDISDLRIRRRDWQRNLNSQIQEISLELMVNIFREVSDHLNYEYRVFNSEEFLKTRTVSDRPFYKKVLETYIFHSFLKDRLSGKMDAFGCMEFCIYSENDRMKMLDSPRRPTMEEMASRKERTADFLMIKQLAASMPNLPVDFLHDFSIDHLSVKKNKLENALKRNTKSIRRFKLPEFSCPLTYSSVIAWYTDSINLLSRAINSTGPESSSLLARYYYLRGLAYLMQEKFQEALLDFQNLYKTDRDIFPKELVKKVIGAMSPDQRKHASRKPELKRLISIMLEKEGDVTAPDEHVKTFQLPKTHMHQDDFMKRIQESGIVKDVDTILRLFDALTIGHLKQIDPETFKDFYNFWKESETEAQEVNLPLEVIEHLDKNECVYKLSSSVKTNYGVGKIALTQKRLFLLTEGRPGYVEIAKFRDIQELENISVMFFPLRIPALKIKTTLKEPFIGNLKNERDLWQLIVKEMWAGKTMADKHKDPQYIQQALTNVLLMDAVVGCMQSPRAIYAASKLAYFDQMKNMVVPKTTSETLKHKINPSAGQTSRQAVNVLLYTPGHMIQQEEDENANPRLWCALSEGKVVLFNATSWFIQQHCIQVGNSKLNCMLGVEFSQIWVGSQDSSIYIINTLSMSCNKQLTEHCTDVTDMVLEDQGSKLSQKQVHSCSLDGRIICWDVKTLAIKTNFQLPDCHKLTAIKLHNSMLWCCVGDALLEVKKNGQLLRRVILEKPEGNHVYFSCFLVFPEKNQLVAACGDNGEVYIWDMKDLSKPSQKIQLQDCKSIGCMILVKNQLWIGGKGSDKARGKIYVVDTFKYSVEKELVAHVDMVRALCCAEDRYVLSGAGREDGKVAIWKVE
ncbi:DENN domain-containing protein 3 [Carcharodon carcharias]|uniref:DENN domain-containing protein 3 n=1 Tax=Carcharodon carcharias TaxID=13397 RepID=UPI001B7F69E1|nr:DENN domain-containing protein 3 [Carcharodon carcharias]XP_041045802.1 DENN domain-containing protein 3 [Carcharodon carcharias]XP_041045803.1 DENN domain-containing protein 3 [Carcharodon carcharias]XP_041045804.1 DENN domain-containing protein 3 [Carcharodon carcharias]XP_041045805.1 DENN domain-containing protein 3 [Carcharodon carcharias]